MTVNLNIKKSVTNTIFIFWLPHKIYRVTNMIWVYVQFFTLSLKKV